MSQKKGARLMQSVSKPEEKYELEEGLRSLERAAEVLADKEKMAKIHKLAGRKHKALMGMMPPEKKKHKIKNLDDLKKVAYAKDNNVDEE
jgi:hypothetical protein